MLILKKLRPFLQKLHLTREWFFQGNFHPHHITIQTGLLVQSFQPKRQNLVFQKLFCKKSNFR